MNVLDGIAGIFAGSERKGVVVNEIIEYTNGHKCVPNGVGDYTFVCPTRGERAGFIPYLMRTGLRGKCECGEQVEYVETEKATA